MDKRKLWAVYDGKGDFKYAQDVEKDARKSLATTEPAGFGQQCELVEFVEAPVKGGD